MEKTKPKLLLHICCAVCGASVIERLVKSYDLTLFYYNPNIDLLEEYEKRKSAIQKYLADRNYGIELIDGGYKPLEFLDAAQGYEGEKEGGARCERCLALRLRKTAEYAALHGYEFFSTTLSVSPHKNFKIIKTLLEGLETETLKAHVEDFKKKDGFLQSTKLAKEYGIYRQNYCGCKFAK